MNTFVRTKALLGLQRFEQLQNLRILIVGAGGVGSHAAQALASLGVKHLHLVDYDVIEESNANRHVQAQLRRIGSPKVDALKEHLEETFPDLQIRTSRRYFSAETVEILDETPDIILECIDHLQAKLLLIQEAQKRDLPIISALGMGNRIDPSKLSISTLFESSGCPLGRNLRREARKIGLKDTPVIISAETPSKTVIDSGTRHAPASIYLVPAACGLLMAYYVISQFTET